MPGAGSPSPCPCSSTRSALPPYEDKAPTNPARSPPTCGTSPWPDCFARGALRPTERLHDLRAIGERGERILRDANRLARVLVTQVMIDECQPGRFVGGISRHRRANHRSDFVRGTSLPCTQLGKRQQGLNILGFLGEHGLEALLRFVRFLFQEVHPRQVGGSRGIGGIERQRTLEAAACSGGVTLAQERGAAQVPWNGAIRLFLFERINRWPAPCQPDALGDRWRSAPCRLVSQYQTLPPLPAPRGRDPSLL